MRHGPAMRRPLLRALAAAPLILAGCRGGHDAEARPAQDAAVTVDSTDLAVADSGTIETGPLVSGSLEPREQATLRAEVGGTVREVLVEPGEAMRKGQPVLRIDAATPEENLESARARVRSAENQVDVAGRNVDRMEHLVAAGAVAERDLEDARSGLASARAQLADAQAGLTQARKQVSDTRPVAPFDGVVSRRPVNTGDVVSPGAELATIIDPFSLRLVASVPTESLAAIRVGAPVEFTVTGYPGRRFEGRVERINPAADPSTRQVTLYVAIPNSDRNLVAGVYAEGRVTSESRRALVVPASATDVSAGPEPSSGPVMRVRQGRVQQVDADFGVFDDRTGLLEVQAGLEPGDTVLVGPAREITPGTPVRVSGPGTRAADPPADSSRRAPGGRP